MTHFQSTAIANLTALVGLYSTVTGRAIPTVSTDMFGTGDALTRLYRGKDMLTARQEKAVQWLSDNWPPETPWPDGIHRPAVAQEKTNFNPNCEPLETAE